MNKKRIDKIEAECQKIINDTQQYNLDAIAFFHRIYTVREKLRVFNGESADAEAMLDHLAEMMKRGLDRKKENLKSCYIEKLNALLEVKREMLSLNDPTIISLLDPLVKNIKELRELINNIKEGTDESRNNKR